MNIDDLKSFYSIISQFDSPEEFFGEIQETDLKKLKDIIHANYKKHLKQYHPDRFHAKGGAEMYYSQQISMILSELYNKAIERADKGKYGKPDVIEEVGFPIFTIQTKIREYRIVSNLMETDFSTIFAGEYTKDSGDVERICVKVALDSTNNLLFRNEISSLKLLKHKSIPVLIDQFRTTENQEAIITRYINGYDLISLKEKYPDGISVAHACWILERLLSVLGHIHFNTTVHGNIEPGNIIVRPSDHNAFLIDFLFTVSNPTRDDTFKGATKDYSAPEVFHKKQPIPHSDIYSLGKTMIYILGGDIQDNTLPSKVDKRIAGLIQSMVKIDPFQRPGDAWKLWHKLSDLRLEVFGDRHQFLEFIIPDDDNAHTGNSSNNGNPGNGQSHKSKHTIKLHKNSHGLFEIKVKINAVLTISLILDSGSSEVCVTPDIYSTLLKTGTINKSDILAPMVYVLANGKKEELQRFNLRILEIDDLILNNVTASVSNSIDAPMLLGQNVLEKIGIFKMDLGKEIIIIE